MSKNVLQAIRGRMESFSRGQKRIADYILMNYDKAAFMTAGHLGRKAQVSESTVVRFASQLGYEGYPNMQRALQELVRGRLTSLQRIQVSRDQMQEQDVLTGVMQRDMNSIHTAIEQLDRAAFDRVVDRLLTASHIYLMGVRSSAFLAGYLNFYLHLMFKNVTLVQNAAAGEIFEQLSQIGPGDAQLIMLPGNTEIALEARSAPEMCWWASAFPGIPRWLSTPWSTPGTGEPMWWPLPTARCRPFTAWPRCRCWCAAT